MGLEWKTTINPRKGYDWGDKGKAPGGGQPTEGQASSQDFHEPGSDYVPVPLWHNGTRSYPVQTGTDVSIVRGPRLEQNFTIVSNDVIRDSRLSYRALGVLMNLLSRPANWRTDSSALARDRKEGRDAVRIVLRELEDAGYLVRARTQDEGGRWTTTSTIFETPQDITAGQTEDGKPGVGEPGVGLSGAIRSTDTKDCEEVGHPDDIGLRSRRADLRSAATKQRPKRKPKVRAPLTGAALQISWQNFLNMDLGDLDTDPEIRNAAFRELLHHHGAIEPDRWAQAKIEAGEWSGFCASFDLGSNLEAVWG